jgi:misacylated tRNA(Ala) deacylase
VTTELLYLTNAYLRDFDATVTAVDAEGRRVDLDRTAFYATGGGQPHDTGNLAGIEVVDVRKEDDHVWHTLGGEGTLPSLGDKVHGDIDWDRRHALMRTHTALHVLCGVIWKEWGKAVTGGNMEPLSARRDFEFDPRFSARDQGDRHRRPRQAGRRGAHVRSTDEVGRIRVLKTESKGKGNKRVRLEVIDG